MAHRGANWHFPENTLPAFRRALQDGAGVLEMDVQRTKDDVIVVCHDPIWHGKRISKVCYESLASQIPRLEDVFQAFPKAKLNIDIKPNDVKAVYLTVDLIRDYGAIGRVCLTSFHWEVQRWLSDLRYEGERGLGRIEMLLLFLLPASMLKLFGWRGRRAQVPVKYGILNFATRYFVEKCHQLGLWVDYWVVNQLEIARDLKALGADAVMTDDPATLMSLSSP